MANLKFKFLLNFFAAVALIGIVPITNANADVKPKIAIVYDSGGKGDAGVNDQTYLGIKKAMTKLKISSFDLKEQIFDPNTAGDRFTRVRFLAKNGYQLIVCVGAGFAPAVNQIGMEFPKTQFAIIDSEQVPLANVTALSFARNEGVFVAGAALALASKSGKVGFFSDSKNTFAKSDLALFTKGATYAKSNIQVVAKNSDDVKTAIGELLKLNVDQIFSTWDSDDQVVKSVQSFNDSLAKTATKVRVSGILPDQFFWNIAGSNPNSVRYLTIKKRTDIAVEEIITATYQDRSMKDVLPGSPGVYGRRYNLKNGGLQIEYVGAITNSARLSTITTAVRTGKINLQP